MSSSPIRDDASASPNTLEGVDRKLIDRKYRLVGSLDTIYLDVMHIWAGDFSCVSVSAETVLQYNNIILILNGIVILKHNKIEC